MIVKSLCLKDFRNYSELKVDFSSGLNFIFGDNGQGKTNLIESLFFSTHLKSFRTSKLETLCKNSCNSFWITTELSKQGVDHKLDIIVIKGRKKVVLDNQFLSYSSDFIRNFFSLLFAPDQLVLFKEYPKVRRAYFDRLLFLIDRQYHIWIKEFNRIKKQKCILLKQKNLESLDIWNKMLSEVIPKITAARNAIADKINQLLSNLLYELTDRPVELLLRYHSNLDGKVENVPSEINSFLEKRKERECEVGYLYYGPHKDDFWMSMGRNGDRHIFSQGEYRISFLSLQLAVNQIIREEMKFRPILLLDDILSELDERTSLKSIEYIAGKTNQVFITSTSIPKRILHMGAAYSIRQGKIIGSFPEFAGENVTIETG